MTVVENQILRKISGVMANNISFETIDALGFEAAGIELFHQAGVLGNFKLQISNTTERWFDVAGSTLPADDAGLYWNVTNLNSRYVRVQFVGANGGSTYEIIVATKDL